MILLMNSTRRTLLVSALVFVTTLFAGCGVVPKTLPEATQTVSATPSITLLVSPTSTEVTIDGPRDDTGYQGYYIGVVVITEYYTLLGNELPQEAYKLLSTSARRHSPNIDQYVKQSITNFKTVEIITIKPLVVWQKENGVASVTPDQEDKIRFYVQLRAWGEGAMSGSVRSGDLQTQYLTLIKEGENWKIDSFATGLVVPTPASSTSIPTLDSGSVPDRSYYDSIIVIAQFHVFFNNGLYESAYQLLSPSRRHAQSLEEFVTDIETFGIVERRIVAIHPFYEGALQLQNFPTPDAFSRRMFYAEIYAIGKGGWAGSVPNGIYGYYITVVYENKEWKIYSTNTVGIP